MATNGRYPQPSNGAPAWSPSALLQPNRKNSPARSQSMQVGYNTSAVPYRTVRDVQQSGTNGQVVFQFMSPNDSSSAGPSSNASTPGGSEYSSPNGQAQWIEQMNNVQGRPSVPQPKRRKTEDGMAYQVPVRGGSGILSDYVKEKRRESSETPTPQSQTVDLTSGMSSLKSILACWCSYILS
jgi:hypothetical protein